MRNKMSEVEQLKHRLAMVKDDLDIIRKFIHDEQLRKAFRDSERNLRRVSAQLEQH